MLILTAIVNFFVVFVFFGLLGNNAGPAFLYSLIIIVALAWLATTELAEKFFRFTHGMRRPIKREVDYLLPVLEELCRRAGIEKVPTLCVADDPMPNAYALGKNTVCVTRGLLKTATEEEIRGVIAHEIGHLKYGHSKRALIAHTLNQVGNVASIILVFFASTLAAASSQEQERRGSGVSFIAIFVALFLKLGLWAFQRAIDLGFLAIGRKEEYQADAYAVQLGVGEGLLSFLEKIADSDFQTKGFWARLEATHPPVMLRIEKVEEAITKGRETA
ncbi:zinc metalloprotease HtpX [Bacillus badius]|uniref:zinc metalloprotease HtpX n=1 Tax=Bacillus badius TaxID=1455 RepID=UPI002E23F4E2|nr:zinc metalloprotease HtpX [Bacillus badius]